MESNNVNNAGLFLEENIGAQYVKTIIEPISNDNTLNNKFVSKNLIEQKKNIGEKKHYLQNLDLQSEGLW